MLEDFNRPYLIISDLQIPFEAERAFEWVDYLVKHYHVPEHNILNVGDETDQYHASMYPKDPEAEHSVNNEIKEARDRLRRWSDRFPYMRIATSNHMLRWMKRATECGFPQQLLRSYQELYQLPPGWVYQDEWVIKTKHPFRIKHGVDLSGKTPYRQCAELSVMSTAFGHLHSSAGLCHVKTMDKNIWAMNTGSLINAERYAFKYEKSNRFKPNIGLGMVFDQGKMPVWLPYPFEK